MISLGVPVPKLAVALVLLGVVLAATLLIVRQINTGPAVRCNSQHACVDAIDHPYVMRRPS